MKRKIVVWGTGKEAGMMLDKLNSLGSWNDNIVAFCDNNKDKKEFRGYNVISPDELEDLDIDVIVVATMYYKDIRKQVERMYPSLLPHITDRMIYESTVISEDQYKKRCGLALPAQSFKEQKATVYTAVIGKYDFLADPEYVSDDIRYVCFTDDRDLHSDIWDIRQVDSDMGNTLKARHIKMFPQEYLEDMDLTIWIDAKYKIIGNLLDYCKRYWRGSGMLCFPHFKWESLCDEVSFLITYRPQWKKEYIFQAADYLKEGLPDEYDTFDTGCIVRQAGNKAVDEVMRMWWDQLVKYNNPRDQIPFRYSLWKSDFKPDICDLFIERNQFIKVSRE